MGWWITLGILILLAVLPLGISAVYDADGAVVRVIAGFIRIKIFPLKKKEKKPKKEKQKKAAPSTDAAPAPQKAAPKPKEAKQSPQPQKKGGSLLDFLPLVDVALKFVGEFFGKTLHVDRLELKLTMAGGDPCDLATNYGRAWAALGNLWPRLEKWLVIKKRDVQLQCDFTSDETLIFARVDITLTLGRLICLAVRYGVRALIEFMKIRKKQKGGALQ